MVRDALIVGFFLLILRPPVSTRTATLVPYSALFRSRRHLCLLRVGFTVPLPLRVARWPLTPPFHPYRRRLPDGGGLFSVALSLSRRDARDRKSTRLNSSH